MCANVCLVVVLIWLVLLFWLQASLTYLYGKYKEVLPTLDGKVVMILCVTIQGEQVRHPRISLLAGETDSTLDQI